MNKLDRLFLLVILVEVLRIDEIVSPVPWSWIHKVFMATSAIVVFAGAVFLYLDRLQETQ